MTIYDQIIDKKLQYDINKEAAKISAFSSKMLEENMNIVLVKIYYHPVSNK